MAETEKIEGKPKAFERVTSSVVFPYSDIDDAIAVAEGLLKGGGMALTRDQLGVAMNLAPGGGGFNTKLSTARIFGVIETIAGKYQLTELGFEIADSSRRQEAMTTAFLNVELYKKVYDEFRGKRLPPRPHGLEAAMMNFGVSQKQAATARQAFDRSARKAGFFPNGSDDRLVMPFGFAAAPLGAEFEAAVDATVDSTAAEIAARAPAPTVAAPVVTPGLHRSILGMLDELPVAKTKWSKAEQADWLQALATMFQVIYKSDDKGEIEVTYTPPKSPFD